MDVLCKPLSGQTELGAVDVGIIFKAGETRSLPDSVAKTVLTNPNFVDAATGKNPNFTCAKCGGFVSHMVTGADGNHALATECLACARGASEQPAPEGAAIPSPALATPIAAFATASAPAEHVEPVAAPAEHEAEH